MSSGIKLIGGSNIIDGCTDLYLSYNTTGGTMNTTINSTFINSNYLYITGTGGTNSYNQFTECSTINFNGSNNDLKSCGAIGSLFNINGSGNTLSNSNIINLTGNRNTLLACSYINLTGSQNNFYYCNAFGQRSGNFNSTQSNYNNNCNYFDTVGTGSFTNVNFTNSSGNVWVLSGQTLSRSNFDNYITNLCFSGSTIQYFENITFNTTLQGTVIGGTLYNGAGVITNSTINDKSFVALNESSQPIAISFSGGTTPYYTNITAFA
jgi:hypothetical protein